MSIQTSERAGVASRRDASELIQFRVLYATCFGLFLLAGVVHRLLPWTWFGREPSPSVFEQARNAAGVCATYAFMA
jgi:hypothetical protein